RQLATGSPIGHPSSMSEITTIYGADPAGAVDPAGAPLSIPVDDANGAEARRRELAAFLRSRRARLTPDDVGLTPGRRRRTPGLRREEVADLAGVGVTWYTWLEQGRDI